MDELRSLALDGTTERSARWSRRDAAVLAAAVVAMLASLAWLVHPFYEASADTSDAALYILCAKSLLAGEGYAYLGQPFVVRPPGLSLAIAPLIGARGVDFHALNLAISASGVLAVALLFVWLRPSVGAWAALAVCAAIWMNPGLRRFSNQVMSDVPGLALLLLALVVERWASARPSIQRELALAAVLAIGVHVRSAVALALPAIVAARAVAWIKSHGWSGWLRFVRERALVVAAATLALLAPWAVRNASATPSGAVDQVLLHSYSTAMWHVDAGDPTSPRVPWGDVLDRVPDRGSRVLAALGSRLQRERPPIGNAGESADLETRVRAADYAIGAALVAALLAALIARSSAAEWTAVALIAVALPYFGFQTRLALPILVLAIASAAQLLFAAVARRAGARAACAAVVAGSLALLVVDFAPRRDFARLGEQHRAMAELCADVARRVPPDRRLAALLGRHYSVHLDRPVWSLWYTMRRVGGGPGVPRAIERTGADAVMLAPFSPLEQAWVPYFAKRYRTEELAGGGVLAWVEPKAPR